MLTFNPNGRTIDISLLTSYKGIDKVKATAGDTPLEGEDSDNVMRNNSFKNLGGIQADFNLGLKIPLLLSLSLGRSPPIAIE